MNKKTLVIFTTDQGHKSISDTLAKVLSPYYEVKIFSDDNFMFAYYIYLYRFFPFATKLPFLFFKNSFLRSLAGAFLDIQYRGKIKRFLEQHQPDIVINAFWMFRPSLDLLLKNSPIQYLTIVTDPWSVHPFVASLVCQNNLAFDEKTVQNIKQLVPEATVTPVGWFVRDAFEESFDKKLTRKNLSFDLEKLTLLFTTGSEGTELIFPIVSSLVKTRLPVQIIVACGTNKHLLKRINDLKKTIKTHIDLHAIPFTKELHLYMRAADLVIGKAGPNSVFEAVACNAPFFATTHIAGQEDGNLDIIRELKIGYVEEDPNKATKLLHQIIENPNELNKFSANLKVLANYNRQAKTRLKMLLDL